MLTFARRIFRAIVTAIGVTIAHAFARHQGMALTTEAVSSTSPRAIRDGRPPMPKFAHVIAAKVRAMRLHRQQTPRIATIWRMCPSA